MPKRSRAGALTVLSLTGLMLGVTLSVQAGAAPAAPRFLSAAELPPHPSSAWTAGKVTDGVPDELLLCLEDALPGYDSRYRDFRTDLETSARQLTIEVGTKAKAAALADSMNKQIRTCADRLEQGAPDLEATYKDYGKVAVEEGARVHGLHTEHSFGATDIRLLSVGRDDRTVTVVEWSQMGDFADAPVKAFKKTTATAVNKLH